MNEVGIVSHVLKHSLFLLRYDATLPALGRSPPLLEPSFVVKIS